MATGAAAARRAPDDGLAARLFEPVETGRAKVVAGLVWATAQLAAVLVGPVALVVVFAPVAAVAGLHAARAWRPAGVRPSRLVAGLAGLALPAAATVGTGMAGAVLLGAAVAALLAAIVRPGRVGIMVTAGTTVRCFLAPALAAGAVVLLGAVHWTVVGSLLLLAAGYDLAVYVWGADEEGPLVGRVVGIVTVGVLGFSLSVVQLVFSLGPFASVGVVWVFAGLAATTFPLGQIVASLMLPDAAAPAPALRRIDSLLVGAPLWLFALWGYLA
ncbi:MAG: hypothetical protein JJU45_13755 [Acidimicrobiia bacterium]|nr:hypothetical protein [Acidimicrobiia bacterium]